MSALICKMCSAPLAVGPDGKFAKCTYCGTVFTLPLEESDAETKAAPLLKRAKMFLADKQFKNASDQFERVLDIMPSLGEAYLGKGLAELNVTKISELGKMRREARNNYFIKKALVFCEGEELAELMKVLGIRATANNVSVYLRQWRPGAIDTRNRFIRALRNKLSSTSAEYDEKAREITQKYSPVLAKLLEEERHLQTVINWKKSANTQGLSYQQVLNLSNEVMELVNKKRDVTRDIVATQNQLTNEINELSKSYPDRRQTISSGEFHELAEQYPLPPLPDEIDENVVEKIYDILLGCYEYLSAEDLYSSRYLSETSHKIIDASVHKLAFEKRIITVTIDGREYYAPRDLDGIVIV